MRKYHGQTIWIFNVSELIKDAAINVVIPHNILPWFQATGIYPSSSGIFKESDFVAAEITDRPEAKNAIEH